MGLEDNNKVKTSAYQQMIDYAEKTKEVWMLNGRNVMWLPIMVPHGITTTVMLEDVYKKFVFLLRQKGSDLLSEENVCQVHTICGEIIELLKLYLRGNVVSAHKKFAKLMDQHYSNTFPHKFVETNYLFYRMRRDEDKQEKKEFYHLPVSLRYLCASERFSIAGYPCFYIGYSKADCKVEISQKGSMVGLSLKNAENLKVLDLTFSKDQEDGSKLKEHLLAWPLIAACYLVMDGCIDTDKAKFREEYVIPQMLTSFLKHRGGYDGICYYSVRNENLNPLGRGEEDFRNLVLFPNLNDENEYDEKLMDKFEWYTPFNV